MSGLFKLAFRAMKARGTGAKVASGAARMLTRLERPFGRPPLLHTSSCNPDIKGRKSV